MVFVALWKLGHWFSLGTSLSLRYHGHRRSNGLAGRSDRNWKKCPPLATYSPHACGPCERVHYELRESLVGLRKCFQQQRKEAWEMHKKNIEENQRISQLEDEVHALYSQIDDLQIQLVMKNSQNAEKSMGIDPNPPAELDD